MFLFRFLNVLSCSFSIFLFLYFFLLVWDGTRKIMVNLHVHVAEHSSFIALTSHVKRLAHMLDSLARVHNYAFSFHCVGKLNDP